jgi:hypothetical protein
LRSTEYKSPVVDGRLQAASDGIGLKREGAMTVSHPIVTTASQLSDEIKEVDVASQADGGNGTHYSITLKAGATLTKARTSLRSTSPAKTRSPSTAGALFSTAAAPTAACSPGQKQSTGSPFTFKEYLFFCSRL